MKRLFLVLSLIICCAAVGVAQNVTRTQHRAAVAQDDVTTGTMTIRKPEYICISTNEGKEQLIMDINNQTLPTGEDLTVTTQKGLKTITITPAKKKRQLFSSFVLVIDTKTSAIRQLRMNGRKGDYTDYKMQ